MSVMENTYYDTETALNYFGLTGHPSIPSENAQYYYDNSLLQMSGSSDLYSYCGSSDVGSADQDHNSIPKEIEETILSILAKPAKKRIRPRRVYAIPVPKPIKIELHRQYPQMLINILNSHHLDTMQSFFSKYCPSNLRMTVSGSKSKPPSQHKRITESSCDNSYMSGDASLSSVSDDDCGSSTNNGHLNPPVKGITINIHGIHAVAEYWSLIAEVVPDQIVSAVTDIHIRRPVGRESQRAFLSSEEHEEIETELGIEGCTLVLSFKVHETDIYDVPPSLYAFTMLAGKSNQHNLPHIRTHPHRELLSSVVSTDNTDHLVHSERPKKRSRMDIDQSQPGRLILSVVDRDTNNLMVNDETDQFSVGSMPIPEMPLLIPVEHPCYSKLTGTMEIQIDENRLIESVSFLNLVVEIQ